MNYTALHKKIEEKIKHELPSFLIDSIDLDLDMKQDIRLNLSNLEFEKYSYFGEYSEPLENNIIIITTLNQKDIDPTFICADCEDCKNKQFLLDCLIDDIYENINVNEIFVNNAEIILNFIKGGI